MFKLCKTMLIALLSILFVFSSSFAEESDVVDDPENVYKNVLDLNPTSDGFYIGYERVLHYSKSAILVFDVKNTSESGDDFGRSGLTFRYAFSPDSILSSRLETAWIDGHNNIAFKIGYDSPLIGISVTGVRSLSDSEVMQSEENVLSSTSVSTDTQTGSSGNYDNFQRDTVTTNEVAVKETKFATPDGILVDFNFNFFEQFSFTLGGSHWEKDDWSETGYHGNIAWHITQGDTVGGHVAHIDGETEGGLFYRKKFHGLGDIFAKGAPFTRQTTPSLFNKVAFTPFATPPIKIMTSSEYVEKRVETKVEETTETYQVRKPDPFKIVNSRMYHDPMTGAEVTYELDATPHDDVASWTITSGTTGLVVSGTSLPANNYAGVTPGTHVFTFTVINKDGKSLSASETVNIP